MAKKKERVKRFEKKLKNLSTGQIEQAVEKAVSELVGDTYQVKIHKIDFKFGDLGSGSESCSVQLTVESHSGFDDDIPF